ncbi:MAG: 23S rRNA (adenine(2503)-C(2))-methyltransferase RlmN [Patescibacteria group bacterium]|mgnify:CR=1 FL=1
MNRPHLEQLLGQLNQPRFRFKQLFQAVYKDGAESFASVQTLPKVLREALAQEPTSTLEPIHSALSKDGTIKTIFELSDGLQIEAVMIPNKNNRTVCVSCQVGCAMKCAFCATGTMGIKRSLTADEIIDQVVYCNNLLRSKKEKVTNVVYMGMGEPMNNLKAVLESIQVLHDADGLGIGARKISVSTSGVVPGIKSIIDFPLQINLALSLHAPNDELRSKIMPVNKMFPLKVLMEACHAYVQKTNRKLMFEYVMLQGVNDSLELAVELRDLAKPFVPLMQVNLIPFHPSSVDFTPTERKHILAFQKVLREANIPTTIRHSAGVDIAGACGQLALDTSTSGYSCLK